MTTWLVCTRCDVKEALLPTTPIVGCQTCGAARYAVNDADQPMFLFTKKDDFEMWDIPGAGQTTP